MTFSNFQVVEDCPHATRYVYDIHLYTPCYIVEQNKGCEGDIYENCNLTCAHEDCQEKGGLWACNNYKCCKVFCWDHLSAHQSPDPEHTTASHMTLELELCCLICQVQIINEKTKLHQRVAQYFQKWSNDRIRSETIPEEGLRHEVSFKYADLIDGLKSKKYSRIVFLTGAGISVNAGIPDFRSPGGVYETLTTRYGVEDPMVLLHLDYFMKDPRPNYDLIRSILGEVDRLLMMQFKPCMGHKFIVEMHNRGQLAKSYAQNVDDLELKAGLPSEKQLNCHGHLRSASCANLECAEPYDIDALREMVLTSDKVPYCAKCGSPVKPDYELYGEMSPFDIHDYLQELLTADLVFVMGTSLGAYPFGGFVGMLPPEAPVVLVNLEDHYMKKPDKFLFLQGDIDKLLKQLLDDINC